MPISGSWSGVFINTEFLSDSKALPFFLLQPNIPTASTFTFGGNFRGQNRNWDMCLEQQFCYGVKLNAGVVPYDWAFPTYPLAISGTRSYTWASAASAASIFIPFVYVWRPSTQAVVGYLWQGYTSGTSLPAMSTGEYGATYNSNTARYGQWTGWRTGAADLLYTKSNVTAQAGDFLVFEVWSTGYAGTGPVSGQLYGYTLNWKIGGPLQSYNTSSDAVGSENYSTFTYQDETKWTGGIAIGGLNAPTPVNLTNVDPQSGPEIRLTFDNPVTADPPTIGAASSGVGVTGVTQVDSTTIDLNLAVRPDTIDGDAAYNSFPPPVGEADVAGPPVPTGIGAEIV